MEFQIQYNFNRTDRKLQNKLRIPFHNNGGHSMTALAIAYFYNRGRDRDRGRDFKKYENVTYSYISPKKLPLYKLVAYSILKEDFNLSPIGSKR